MPKVRIRRSVWGFPPCARRRHVRAFQKRCPDPWPVFLKPWLEFGRLKAIDPGRARVRHDPSIRLPQVGFLHHGLHQPWRFRFRSPASRRATLSTGFGPQRVPLFALRPGRAFACFRFFGLHRGPPSYFRSSCSGLRQITLPTMPSADFWPFLPAPLDTGSTVANARSPRVLRACLHAYVRRMTPALSVQVSGFDDHCRLTQRRRLVSLRVPRTSALPSASFRSPVAQDTLAVQLTLPLAGRVEDFTSKQTRPAGRTKKKPRRIDGAWI